MLYSGYTISIALYTLLKQIEGVIYKFVNETYYKIKEKCMIESYNKTTIAQLVMWLVKIKHNNKQNMCKFSLVPGSGQALLGMPGIGVLNIVNINVNTIDMEDGSSTDNCCKNKAIL